MKIVNVYRDNVGDYALEYEGLFYGFFDDARERKREKAKRIAFGEVDYGYYSESAISSLNFTLIDTYEFEDN